MSRSGVAGGAGLGAAYFGYGASVRDPLRVGVIGTVFEDMEEMRTSPYVLCRTCDQDVGVPGRGIATIIDTAF